MPEEIQSLEQHVYSSLFELWPNVEIDEDNNTVTCPKGTILSKSRDSYHFKFFSYSVDNEEYNESNFEIVFPVSFDIKKYIRFKRSGTPWLLNEANFKKIINPQGKTINAIKLVSGDNVKRVSRGKLHLSVSTFEEVMKDAGKVYKKSNSCKTSIANYLANIESEKYSRYRKKRTTSIEKGEFEFAVHRLNLSTKKKSGDFKKYLNEGDIDSLESLINQLIRHEVLSSDFLHRLDDYFIKEKLKDIIAIGKRILSLKSSDTTTEAAIDVIKELGSENIGQMEAIWQRYFEKYLLYLIFSYKNIFPKVELKGIADEKKYPDFIGVNHYNGLDVIEIKTHLPTVLTWDSSHNNFYFSADMSKAIVQTMNYLDAITQERFKKGTDKRKILDSVGDEENLYHPRGIIIISSSSRLASAPKMRKEPEKLKRDFTKLRNSLHNIQILTFDEILSIADTYIKNIVSDTHP